MILELSIRQHHRCGAIPSANILRAASVNQLLVSLFLVYTHTHTYTHPHILSISRFSFSLSLALSLSRSLAHSLSRSLALSRSRSLRGTGSTCFCTGGGCLASCALHARARIHTHTGSHTGLAGQRGRYCSLHRQANHTNLKSKLCGCVGREDHRAGSGSLLVISLILSLAVSCHSAHVSVAVCVVKYWTEAERECIQTRGNRRTRQPNCVPKGLQ